LVVYDEVGKAIGEADQLQSLLDRILEQLLSGTAADWGLLLLRSQFSNRLELRSILNLSLSPAQHEALNNAQGFLGPLVQAPKNHIVPDFDEHELSSTLPRLGFETSSLLISPIMLGDVLLGLIILGGLERDQFDLNMLNLTKGVARQAAQAILNARHREEEQARSRHGREFVRF
jgi:GAF domain-containing protein